MPPLIPREHGWHLFFLQQMKNKNKKRLLNFEIQIKNYSK